jgi:vacuolar-type H+-ATPase subunit H
MISSTLLLGILVAFVIGIVCGYIARQIIAKNQVKTAEGQVSQIITEAKATAQDTLLDAKNKAVDMLEKAEEEEKERKQAIRASENRLEKRENILDKKLDEAESSKEA